MPYTQDTHDKIKKRLAENHDLTSAYLADVAGLSPDRFRRNFKEREGVSFKEYCTNLRGSIFYDKAIHRKIKALLEDDPNISKSDLASGVGVSEDTVSRRFTHFEGMSLQAYRDELGADGYNLVRHKEVKNHLKDDHKLTVGDIAGLIGMSEQTVTKRFNALEGKTLTAYKADLVYSAYKHRKIKKCLDEDPTLTAESAAKLCKIEKYNFVRHFKRREGKSFQRYKQELTGKAYSQARHDEVKALLNGDQGLTSQWFADKYGVSRDTLQADFERYEGEKFGKYKKNMRTQEGGVSAKYMAAAEQGEAESEVDANIDDAPVETPVPEDISPEEDIESAEEDHELMDDEDPDSLAGKFSDEADLPQESALCVEESKAPLSDEVQALLEEYKDGYEKAQDDLGLAFSHAEALRQMRNYFFQIDDTIRRKTGLDAAAFYEHFEAQVDTTKKIGEHVSLQEMISMRLLGDV